MGWDVPKIHGTDEPISRAEIATNMHVDFNFQLDSDGEDRDEEAFAIVELVEDQLEDLDYAIVRLENTPGRRFGITPIAAEDPPRRSTICIIGHPAGLPKRVDAGLASDYDDFRIVYADVDTKSGSSGSGILTSPRGPIVGVHTTGGCDNPLIRTNHGIRISRLLEASPTLKKLAVTSKCRGKWGMLPRLTRCQRIEPPPGLAAGVADDGG